MTAYVCVIEIHLHLNDSHDLKGKRKTLHSLKAQVRQRFGASVAEVDGQDTWQRSTLAVSFVSGDSGWIEKSVHDVRRVAERDDRALVSGFDYDITPDPW